MPLARWEDRRHMGSSGPASTEADFVVWDAEQPVEIVYEPGRNPLYQQAHTEDRHLTQWYPRLLRRSGEAR